MVDVLEAMSSEEAKDFEGQIVKNSANTILIDARPYVMSKIRPFFKTSSSDQKGFFTHEVIEIGLSKGQCRDLEMFLTRYDFCIDEKLLDEILRKAREFDEVSEKVRASNQNTLYVAPADGRTIAVDLLDDQKTFFNLASYLKRTLLADPVGKGKTFSGLSMLSLPDSLRCLIVCPNNITTQWEDNIKIAFPDLRTHLIKGYKNYQIPLEETDVVIVSFNCLPYWKDALVNIVDPLFRYLLIDEVHELRNSGSSKSVACKAISETCEYCVGMSGTPIMNYGGEIFDVIDAIYPTALGTRSNFINEWCTGGNVIKNPEALHQFLISSGLMIRREGKSSDKISTQVVTVPPDLGKVDDEKAVAVKLALSLLTGSVSHEGETAMSFDLTMRKLTGIAKARSAIEFVKTLVDQGEKVVLVGWHRDVYDIWSKFMTQNGIKFVMSTGSESKGQKELSKKEFIEADADVFVLSLRGGAGIDGLQKVCNTMVIAELDWSPNMMEQIVGRLDRIGQNKFGNAYILITNYGLDPMMMGVLGIKKSQHLGIVEGNSTKAKVFIGGSESKTTDRMKEAARAFLLENNIELPEEVITHGVTKQVADLLANINVPMTQEKDMQLATHDVLNEHLKECIVHREYVLDKKNRLDFLVTSLDEKDKVVVELKINSGNKKAVYNQIRRYIEAFKEKGGISGVILFAPWSGVNSFNIDEIPVVVIDSNKGALKM